MEILNRKGSHIVLELTQDELDYLGYAVWVEQQQPVPDASGRALLYVFEKECK